MKNLSTILFVLIFASSFGQYCPDYKRRGDSTRFFTFLFGSYIINTYYLV